VENERKFGQEIITPYLCNPFKKWVSSSNGFWLNRVEKTSKKIKKNLVEIKEALTFATPTKSRAAKKAESSLKVWK
jgi:hypothetical protein